MTYTFKTIGAPQKDYAYIGDRPDWYVVWAQTRDSDTIEKSNYRSVKRDLEVLAKELYGDLWDEHLAEESLGHWAVGWVECLLVSPDSTELLDLAEEASDKVKNVYPLYDEDDHSALELEESDEQEETVECYRQDHEECQRMDDTEDDEHRPHCACYCHEVSCPWCGLTINPRAEDQQFYLVWDKYFCDQECYQKWYAEQTTELYEMAPVPMEFEEEYGLADCTEQEVAPYAESLWKEVA